VRDFITAILRVSAEDEGSGKMLSGPLPMRTEAGRPDLAPDVFFVRSEHRDRLKPDYLDGPAVPAVEFAAAGGLGRREAYERAGVAEYWVVCPESGRAEFWALGEDGRYRAVPVEESGIVRGRVLPRLWVRTEWLCSDPLPLVRTVLIEWGLPRLFSD
jgi:hypothetical protein